MMNFLFALSLMISNLSYAATRSVQFISIMEAKFSAAECENYLNGREGTAELAKTKKFLSRLRPVKMNTIRLTKTALSAYSEMTAEMQAQALLLKSVMKQVERDVALIESRNREPLTRLELIAFGIPEGKIVSPFQLTFELKAVGDGNLKLTSFKRGRKIGEVDLSVDSLRRVYAWSSDMEAPRKNKALKTEIKEYLNFLGEFALIKEIGQFQFAYLIKQFSIFKQDKDEEGFFMAAGRLRPCDLPPVKEGERMFPDPCKPQGLRNLAIDDFELELDSYRWE